MVSIAKKCSRNIVSLVLALTLAVIFYALPLNGEMCSTMISAVDGENLSALQKRAFSSFRSTCRKEPPLQSATLKGTSLCAQNTYLVDGTTMMELQLPMTSPVRLEVTVSVYTSVFFSPDGPGLEGDFHAVDLHADKAKIRKPPSPPSTQLELVQSKSGNYIGVPVIITYDNGRFEVAVQGVPELTLTYDVTSPAQPSWFVSLFSSPEGELSFADPCINDFNPKFISQ
ncbi:uncharacterized protein [Asterias amurensis]|uniref:uncharacterized protein n=1 Tax=Asterias amurensis TaxID=7602 RepID=UPI003AB7CE6E